MSPPAPRSRPARRAATAARKAVAAQRKQRKVDAADSGSDTGPRRGRAAESSDDEFRADSNDDQDSDEFAPDDDDGDDGDGDESADGGDSADGDEDDGGEHAIAVMSDDELDSRRRGRPSGARAGKLDNRQQPAKGDAAPTADATDAAMMDAGLVDAEYEAATPRGRAKPPPPPEEEHKHWLASPEYTEIVQTLLERVKARLLPSDRAAHVAERGKTQVKPPPDVILVPMRRKHFQCPVPYCDNKYKQNNGLEYHFKHFQHDVRMLWLPDPPEESETRPAGATEAAATDVAIAVARTAEIRQLYQQPEPEQVTRIRELAMMMPEYMHAFTVEPIKFKLPLAKTMMNSKLLFAVGSAVTRMPLGVATAEGDKGPEKKKVKKRYTSRRNIAIAFHPKPEPTNSVPNGARLTTSDFALVPPELAVEYLPQQQDLTVHLDAMPKGSTQRVAFGTAISSSSRFLAVGGFRHFDDMLQLGKRYPDSTSDPRACKGAIQIWRISTGAASELNAALEMLILHDHGHVIDMDWCRPGAYSPAAADGEVTRLGYLAVSFSDGAMCVYAVPKPSSLRALLGEEDLARFENRPLSSRVMVVDPHRSLCGDEFDFDRDLFVGFQAHDSVVQKMSWCTISGKGALPENVLQPRYLFTVGQDGLLSYRDIHEPWASVVILPTSFTLDWCESRKMLLFTAGEYESRAIAFDAPVEFVIQKPSRLGKIATSHTSQIWDVCGSHNGLAASVGADGQLVIMNLGLVHLTKPKVQPKVLFQVKLKDGTLFFESGQQIATDWYSETTDRAWIASGGRLGWLSAMLHEVLAVLLGHASDLLPPAKERAGGDGGDGGGAQGTAAGHPAQRLLHPAERESLARLQELGAHFTRLRSFVESAPSVPSTPHGSYLQALSAGVRTCMDEYACAVVAIERRVLDPGSLETRGGKTPLSWLLAELQEFQVLLVHLVRVVDIVQGRVQGDENIEIPHGLQILDVLYDESLCGIPIVSETMQRLHSMCLRVFCKQLVSWMLYGSLADPHNEFFVVPQHVVDQTLTRRRLMRWSDLFGLREEMIPHCITAELAETILFNGKAMSIISIQEIEACCADMNQRVSRILWDLVVVEENLLVHLQLPGVKNTYAHDLFGSVPVLLDYDLAWPLDLLLTPYDIQMYGSVFSFLLMDLVDVEFHKFSSVVRQPGQQAAQPMAVSSTPTLDDIQAAHTALLQRIFSGCFLDGSAVGQTVREAMDLCGAACGAIERWIAEGVEAAQTIESLGKQFESRAALLFQIFSGAESVHSSLAQLLIRLDFNSTDRVAPSSPPSARQQQQPRPDRQPVR
nr:Gamma-tubulin complex component 4 [Polyrhizophydium stewartii]